MIMKNKKIYARQLTEKELDKLTKMMPDLNKFKKKGRKSNERKRDRH